MDQVAAALSVVPQLVPLVVHLKVVLPQQVLPQQVLAALAAMSALVVVLLVVLLFPR